MGYLDDAGDDASFVSIVIACSSCRWSFFERRWGWQHATPSPCLPPPPPHRHHPKARELGSTAGNARTGHAWPMGEHGIGGAWRRGILWAREGSGDG
jgi:hypothetical protein